MKKKTVKKIIFVVLSILVLRLLWIFVIGYLINNGFANADSDIESWFVCDTIPSSNRQVHKYLSEHPENTEDICEAYTYLNGTDSENPNWFPKNNWWLDFVIQGIDTRKIFIDTITNASDELRIDPDITLACVLAEQIRIANKWARDKLKWLIMHSTPKLLRSYNVSLGIWWIKLTTAFRTRDEALKNAYRKWPIDNMAKVWLRDAITTSGLADNDELNATYATFLVKNIITRRQNEWVDIDNNPWVICTLYNFGNDPRKKPHKDPQIWGSIINIWGKDFTYWWLAMWAYRYLKVFHSRKIDTKK